MPLESTGKLKHLQEIEGIDTQMFRHALMRCYTVHEVSGLPCKTFGKFHIEKGYARSEMTMHGPVSPPGISTPVCVEAWRGSHCTDLVR